MAMDISSITRSAMTAATQSLAVNANNVANAQTPEFASKRADLQDQAAGGVQVSAVRDRGAPIVSGQSNVDYAQEISEAANAKTLAAAQTAVVKTQDAMLGAVMDMRG